MIQYLSLAGERRRITAGEADFLEKPVERERAERRGLGEPGAPELLLGAMLPGEALGAGEAGGEASPPVGAGEGAGAFWAQAMPAVSNRAVEASQRVRMGYSPGRSGCSAMRIIPA